MTKPSQTARWATDVGATLEPSEGEKGAGFSYGDKPPARWLNWLWNVSYRWQEYLKNLHSEPDFLGADYAWNGAHSFDSDLTFGGALKYAVSPIPRIMIPLASGLRMLDSPTSSYLHSGDSIALHGDGTNAMRVLFPLRLPNGAQLTEVRAACRPNASQLELRVQKKVVNKSSPGFSSLSDIALTAPALRAGGSGEDIITAALAAIETINNTTSEYFLSIDVGTDTSTWATIRWADARVPISQVTTY